MLFAYRNADFRRAEQDHLATLLDVVAEDAVEALQSSDNAAMADTALAAFHHEQRIATAVILDAHGTVVGRYPASASPAAGLTSLPAEQSLEWEGSRLRATAVLRASDGHALGILRADYNAELNVEEWLHYHLAAFLWVAALAAALAYLLSRYLDARVSRPLRTLASVVGRISAEQDFTLRAPRRGDDEIGRLTDGFNRFLERLQIHARELAQSEARFHGALDGMLEGAQIIDREWRYVYLNAAAAQQSRRRREDMLGRTLMECFPQIEGTEFFVKLRQCMQDRCNIHLENEFPCPDGGSAWFELSVLAVPEGLFILSLDIDSRKRIETALREAKDQAESSDRLKTEFLASMSHELRTPLNAIIGFTGTLLMKLPGPINAEQEKQLKTVQSSGRHLLSLISDLLDVAKIESGKVSLHLESVVAQQLVDEAVASLRPAAIAKGLAFEVRMPDSAVQLRIDRRALSQILLNLIGNAVKFTERGSISVTLLAPVEGRVRISVVDTGIGIAAEEQSRLFRQSFVQIRTAASGRVQEGTGLGLYLSHRLAQLLGGDLSLRSESGQGSCFTLSLPTEAAEAASVRPQMS
ncbi:MAG: PAS domain-containing protein [Xanthomonadaceae bacterium]|nr:PAS domain-containing protein [Xanthomonadaceae bacterium]